MYFWECFLTGKLSFCQGEDLDSKDLDGPILCNDSKAIYLLLLQRKYNFGVFVCPSVNKTIQL